MNTFFPPEMKNKKLITSILVLVISILVGTGMLAVPQPPAEKNEPEALSSENEILGASSRLIDGQSANLALVNRVIDGDTIEVVVNKQKYTVRLIGVDTPETVDPRRGVQCFGREASDKTKELLSSKQVYLVKDVSETDKYDRLLRLVYLPIDNDQFLFVNEYLVRQGYAQVSTYPPDVKFEQTFIEAQQFAQQNRVGLWGQCQSS